MIEEHEIRRQERAGHQALLVSSMPSPRTANGAGRGGVVIIAKDGLKRLVTETKAGVNWAAFTVQNISIAAVYLRPSWNDSRCAELLTEIAFADLVIGDFNARLGPAVGDSQKGPRGRVTVLFSWMNLHGFAAQTPERSEIRPKLDHVVPRIRLDGPVRLLAAETLGITSDHYATQVRVDTQPIVETRKDDGLLRYKTALLNDPAIAARFCQFFRTKQDLMMDILEMLSNMANEQAQPA